jgi:hypothetical protein
MPDPLWIQSTRSGRKGGLAIRAKAKAKSQCPNCKKWYSAIGLSKHVASCLTKTAERNAQRRQHHAEQTVCSCGRPKLESVRACPRCTWRESEDTAELQRLIDAGIDTPRARLEVEAGRNL